MSIVDKVRGYIASSAGQIIAQEISELSEKAVVVRDNHDETDVYFDTGSYIIAYAGAWRNSDGDNVLVPPALRGTGLSVLPGIGRLPNIKDSTDAFNFAKQQLIPKNKEARWFKRLKR